MHGSSISIRLLRLRVRGRAGRLNGRSSRVAAARHCRCDRCRLRIHCRCTGICSRMLILIRSAAVVRWRREQRLRDGGQLLQLCTPRRLQSPAVRRLVDAHGHGFGIGCTGCCRCRCAPTPRFSDGQEPRAGPHDTRSRSRSRTHTTAQITNSDAANTSLQDRQQRETEKQNKEKRNRFDISLRD